MKKRISILREAKHTPYGILQFEKAVYVCGAWVRILQTGLYRAYHNWRSFCSFMHLYENHFTKRAGMAGI